MNIQYDKPIEVKNEHYNLIMNAFGQIVAGRQENGRSFIKLWVMSFKPELQSLLTKLGY